jgi:hypothetical protein
MGSHSDRASRKILAPNSVSSSPSRFHTHNFVSKISKKLLINVAPLTLVLILPIISKFLKFNVGLDFGTLCNNNN